MLSIIFPAHPPNQPAYPSTPGEAGTDAISLSRFPSYQAMSLCAERSRAASTIFCLEQPVGTCVQFESGPQLPWQALLSRRPMPARRRENRLQMVGILPTVVGTIRTMVGTIRTMVGTIRTVVGSICTMVGSICTMVGTILSMVGTICPMVGGFPRLAAGSLRPRPNYALRGGNDLQQRKFPRRARAEQNLQHGGQGRPFSVPEALWPGCGRQMPALAHARSSSEPAGSMLDRPGSCILRG
jgi:hypothetical protein